MRKVALPVLLICALFALAACSSPADQPARKWVKFLNAQQKLVEEGTFDVAQFKEEGAKIVEKLRPHVDHTEHKLLLTETVLKDWTEANTTFEKACNDAENAAAMEAYAWLADELMREPDEGAANSE
ncbi:MAG: hypothetical protein KDB68_04595 [Planctomycetes bacterium]|nr:hypothetical protein [Planctomycetota bacterium]MCA8935462.1 hypothetical protein [Planctomycetota bacterium]